MGGDVAVINHPKTDEAEVASPHSNKIEKALLAAALLLPITGAVMAEPAPEKSTLSFKYLDYLDSQPGADRVRIRAPMLMLDVPFKDEWLLNSSFVSDTVSGASPRYHTRQLTKLFDVRSATTLGLTRLLTNGSVTVASAYSSERDYVSKSLSVTAAWFFNNKNTEVTFGSGITRDAINPTNKIVSDEKKRINDFVIGVTQVLTPKDIAQLTVRYSDGSGYYSDPYKAFDERPRNRTAKSVLARWNHYFDSIDGSARIAYRFYTDSFNIDAHTLNFEYAQLVGNGWTVMPLVRLYSQNSASFYVPVDPAQGERPTFPNQSAIYYSEDQRLSAFGGLTVGMKLSKQITKDFLVDAKIEQYEQRSNWTINGTPDLGLAPFSARSVQIGFSYQF